MFFRVLLIKKMNVLDNVPLNFNVIPVGSSFFMNFTREVWTKFSQTTRENCERYVSCVIFTNVSLDEKE